VLGLASVAYGQQTYAERLGYPKDARVVLIHCDDVGMFIDGDLGAIKAIEDGVVTSASTMMPCGWVTHWAEWLKKHPDFDNGLHLTLTSEWRYYRWGPVAGASRVPGLVDKDGYFWHEVPGVVAHASADEVEIEIRAQLAKARAMGLPVTHLDTHMGTVYATPEYFQAYCRVGMEEHIPVMIMGGHMTALTAASKDDPTFPQRAALARQMAEKVWNAGLPVLDDLDEFTSIKDLDEKKKVVRERLHNQKPGVTMYITHCTIPSEDFSYVSYSGPNRHSDTLAMSDPDLKKFIEDEGIILTTWKELKARRDKAK
jgi:predicted glycoside hydrolase/deacetylase ChbG (UPF0249 family)